jgi:hypothetical protein
MLKLVYSLTTLPPEMRITEHMTKDTLTATKRSIARRFNDVLAQTSGRQAQSTKQPDQRTEKRLNRYRDELSEGSIGNRALSPLDIAMRVDELLAHGDKISGLRKIMTPRQVDLDHEHLVSVLKEMHPLYNYRPAAYRFAGVSDEALLDAGIIEKIPGKRGPKAKQE